MNQPYPLLNPNRVAALASYECMDTPPEFEYDALTELAAQICDFPIALISLMDEHRQWFKSNYGVPDMTECPSEISVCSTTVCANEILYVPDLTMDERFKNLPVVAGEPYIRAYCGMPLINPEGYTLGTLCIMDFEPHKLTPAQRENIRRLARQAMSLLELRKQLISREVMLEVVQNAKANAEEAYSKSAALLQSVFPSQIADELHNKGKVEPRFYDMATAMFADFKDSTLLTEGMEPAQLIEHLNSNFAMIDEIGDANRVATLRTIGDGCLCVAGIPETNRTHPVDMCLMALQLQHAVAKKNRKRELVRLKPWQLRIGINTGSVVAGVVGTRRYTYDVWGSAVNLAARLEQACEPGRINVSPSTLHYVENYFETESQGSIEVKNMGSIDMYCLYRIKPEFSDDEEGCKPNSVFLEKAGIQESSE